MKPFPLEKISLKITPACITLLAFLLGAALSRFGANWQIMPDFVLMNIFFWSLFIDKSLPSWFLFVLGVMQDSINGTPLGSSSFIYMLLSWVIAYKLRVVQDMSFLIIWLVFIACAFGVALLQWVIASLYYLHFMPFTFHHFQLWIMFFSYPLVQIFLTMVWQKLNRPL